MSRPDRRLAAPIGTLLLVSYAYFFQGGGWNPNARLDMTRALAKNGTIVIDDYVANTGDWAHHGGHYYANKAPGLSFLAAPVWMAIRAGLPRTTTIETRAWCANVVVNAVPAALLGVALFWTLGALGASARARTVATLAYGLGTLAFPYATAFYAHQPAAVFAFGAFAALVRSRREGASAGWVLAAGAAAGMAVLLETSTAIAVVVLAAWLAAARDGRALALFVAGGLPFAAALATYGWIAFGDPTGGWTRYANPEVEVRVDGALFGWPSAERLAALLVGGHRGLFFTSPVLALAVLGWPALRRRHAGPAWVCAAIVAAFVLLVASFHAWHGGWAPGPRYLVPCLPFAAVPLAFAVDRWPRLFAVTAALSVAIMTAITLVAVEIPQSVDVPLRDFVMPFLREGRVSVNAQGMNDHVPGPGYLQMKPPENAHSRNAGELLFPGHVASALPLLTIWAALGAVVIGWLRRSEPEGQKPDLTPKAKSQT